jgi:CheY-like chemotaxis protein
MDAANSDTWEVLSFADAIMSEAFRILRETQREGTTASASSRALRLAELRAILSEVREILGFAGFQELRGTFDRLASETDDALRRRLRAEASALRAELESLSEREGAPRALVVDDEEGIVEVLSVTLRRAGFVVFGTTRSRQALDELSEFRPDVLLSDIAMPELSGPKLLEEVRRRGSSVPIIFVSGIVGDLDASVGPWDRRSSRRSVPRSAERALPLSGRRGFLPRRSDCAR